MRPRYTLLVLVPLILIACDVSVPPIATTIPETATEQPQIATETQVSTQTSSIDTMTPVVVRLFCYRSNKAQPCRYTMSVVINPCSSRIGCKK